MEDWSFSYLIASANLLSNARVSTLDIQEVEDNIHLASFTVDIKSEDKPLHLESKFSIRDVRLARWFKNPDLLHRRYESAKGCFIKAGLPCLKVETLDEEELIKHRLLEAALDESDLIKVIQIEERSSSVEIQYCLKGRGKIYTAEVNLAEIDFVRTFNLITAAKLFREGYIVREIKGCGVLIFTSPTQRQNTVHIVGRARCDCREFTDHASCRHTRTAVAVISNRLEFRSVVEIADNRINRAG